MDIPIQVSRTTDGYTYIFQMRREDNVGRLKELINERTGYTSDEYKLIFRGGNKPDNYTIGQYIRDRITIIHLWV